MIRNLVLSLALVCLCCSSATSQVVVFSTRDGGRIAGLDFSPFELVRYDIEFDSASIFSSNLSSGNLARPVNLDALHISEEGDLLFSIRGGTTRINELSARHTDIVSILQSSSETSRFFRAGNDIAGFDLLPSGNFLFSTKVDTIIDGETFEIGSIIEVDSMTGTASTFFDPSNFFTVEDGGTLAKGNIDAIEVLPNGNLLLSTSSTAEIGTAAENAVRILQSGVYEYDLATGSVTTFLDPSVFQNNSADVKSFAVLSPVSVLLPGDVNIDGVVNFFDIGPMVELLLIGSAGGPGGYLVQADCNLDGVVNFFDVPIFVDSLLESLGSE